MKLHRNCLFSQDKPFVFIPLRVIVTDNNNISVIGLASSLNPAVMSASQSYLHLVLIAF